MSALRLLASALLCLCSSLASPAEENWELFATSRTGKVYFDRGSVSKAEDYVQYRVRVEYGTERETRDRRHRYRFAVNGLAAQCEAKKVAMTSIALLDGAGVQLTASARERERWAAALTEVAPGGVEEKLLQHACALARGENPQPPQAQAEGAPPRCLSRLSASGAPRKGRLRDLEGWSGPQPDSVPPALDRRKHFV